LTGKAEYVSTGRPNANTHYSWRDCYFIHSTSHYYPAFQVCFLYAVYSLIAMNYGFDLLPMIVMLLSCGLWLVAPILFCPQPTMVSINKDLSEFWQFCTSTRDFSTWVRQREQNKNTEDMLKASINDARSTLFEVWLRKELKKKDTPWWQRFVQVVFSCMRLCLVGAILPTTMTDQFFDAVVNTSLIQMCLCEAWRSLNRPVIMMLAHAAFGIVGPIWVFGMSWLEFAICVVVLSLALNFLNDLILCAYWAFNRPNNAWPDLPDGTADQRSAKRDAKNRVIQYDAFVEYLFVNFQSHLQHLCCALFILLVNLAAQLVLVVLEMCGGIHSFVLLNANLSGAYRHRRRGYEPQ